MGVGLTIVVDQDGVIRNFTKAFNILYNEFAPGYGCSLVPLDYEPLFYRIEKDSKYCKELVGHIIGKYLGDLISIAEPYPESYKFLENLKKMGFNLVTTTSTPDQSVVLQWLRKHSFMRYFSDFYFIGRERYKLGDIIIDDRIENLVEADRNSKIALAIKRRWNEGWYGFRGNYHQVLNYIKDLLGR